MVRTYEKRNAVEDAGPYNLRRALGEQIFKNYLRQKKNENSVIESSASVAEVARLAVTEGL